MVLLTVFLPTMTLNQRWVQLLLLGITIASGAADPLCDSSDMTRCVCNIRVISNSWRMKCAGTLELELRDGRLDVDEIDISSDPNFAFQLLTVNKLTFNNVTIPFSFIGAVITFLPLLPQLNEISLISSTLEFTQSSLILLQEPTSLVSLQLEDTTLDPIILTAPFQPLHLWLFGALKSLSLVRSGLVEIDCNWAQKAENLTHLDLSENPTLSLQNIPGCGSSLSFWSLESLHLRHVNLSSLQSLCPLITLTPALVQLDVSGNNFGSFLYPQCLQEKPIKMLGLSKSGITEVNSLPSTSLEELDLSYNFLEVFDNPPRTLTKLNLSHNRLIRLPTLGHLSHLKELMVDSNHLTFLVDKGSDSLKALEKLHVLHAGRNPYKCDCGLEDTIDFLLNTNSLTMDEYEEEYVCAAPESQKGTQMIDLELETCNSGTKPHDSPLFLTLFVGLLAHQIVFG